MRPLPATAFTAQYSFSLQIQHVQCQSAAHPGGSLLIILQFYFAVFLFKLLNILADQVNDLAVRGTSVILRNIMQLVMQFAVYPKSKMLAFIRFLFCSINSPRPSRIKVFGFHPSALLFSLSLRYLFR